MKRRKHVGSSLDECLAEDGTPVATEAAALKRVIAWQVERGMGEKKMSKSEMARAMRTSRAALDRLLDPKNESVTLRTMARAAKVLGKRLKLELAWPNTLAAAERDWDVTARCYFDSLVWQKVRL